MTTRRLAVASGKGGVGKSTVALGLALALRDDGLSVGLLDADLYGPDIPRMLGLTRRAEAKHLTLFERRDADQRPRPLEWRGLKVWSTQFLVAEQQGIGLPSSLAGVLLDRAFSVVDWGHLDWLIVDLPPGTADVQQHVGRIGLDGVLVVVTPQDVAHLDARKLLDAFRRFAVAVVGGVENMTSMSCPSCGADIELYPSTAHERTIWADGVERLADIPWSESIRRSAWLGDAGETLDGGDTSGLFSGLAAEVVRRIGA